MTPGGVGEPGITEAMELEKKQSCEEDKSCASSSTHTPGVPKVCQSCEHLYGNNGGVILSPSSLVHAPQQTSMGLIAPRHPPSQHIYKAPVLRTPLALWTTRRYGGLCECGRGDGQCRCSQCEVGSSRPPLQSRTPAWWSKVKVALLVIAAILPWVFLVTYLILYYRT
ncbi:hypothetical protein Pmani_019774 [Petrolisthes manimaculis]|uniref:Uncharacterized protein n=1 Tax=Petrolisthes manimaculis TaxID=1843537 RepID=A0AAE1PHV8_9EUCA|nr:hypothetical protein Pmani_019774 [Petrolisthes manimaculis]